MSKSGLYTVRSYLPSDKNFIYASWLRGLYYGEPFFREIPKDVFMEHYHRVLEVILAKQEIAIKVACLKDDPEVILGYSVLSPGVCHWVFVKAAWRGIGIAKTLVPDQFNTASHITKIGLGIMKKRSNMKFNPFVVNYLK